MLNNVLLITILTGNGINDINEGFLPQCPCSATVMHSSVILEESNRSLLQMYEMKNVKGLHCVFSVSKEVLWH